MKSILLSFLATATLLLAESNTTQASLPDTYTTPDYYVGFGWKTFQIGTTHNGGTVVNGDGVQLIAGRYDPRIDLKVEISATVLGYLEYKNIDSNGVAISYNNEIREGDYVVSLAYGASQRNAKMYAFPFVILAGGVKVIEDSSAGTFNFPMMQAGAGFSIRRETIEFFIKYYYDILFSQESFTAYNGDVITTETFNGSLEVGLNVVF